MPWTLPPFWNWKLRLTIYLSINITCFLKKKKKIGEREYIKHQHHTAPWWLHGMYSMSIHARKQIYSKICFLCIEVLSSYFYDNCDFLEMATVCWPLKRTWHLSCGLLYKSTAQLKWLPARPQCRFVRMFCHCWQRQLHSHSAVLFVIVIVRWLQK